MAREGRDGPPASINNLHGKHPISPAPHTAALHMHLPSFPWPAPCNLQCQTDKHANIHTHTHPCTHTHILTTQQSPAFGADIIPRSSDWLRKLVKDRDTCEQTEGKMKQIKEREKEVQ